MASSSTPALLDLPKELLHIIFRNLSIYDLLHLSATCQFIRDILINDIRLWKPLQYELFLTNDHNQNIKRIDSLMISPFFSCCTRLRVIKLNNVEIGECIPKVFFSKLLPALSHQLKELCLLHQTCQSKVNSENEISNLPALSHQLEASHLSNQFKCNEIPYCARYIAYHLMSNPITYVVCSI